MRLPDIARLRLRSLWRRSRVEDELAREMRFHLDQQIEENVAKGMPREEAEAAARRLVGNVESWKESCRDARRTEWLAELARDLRYAGRTLANDRGFAAAAVLSLALGIGLNTALFSVVDAVMLKSLPVEAPERLVAIDRVNARGEKDNFSYPLFEAIRDGVPVFAGTFAALHGTDRAQVTLPEKGAVVEADLRYISADYFAVLGVRPMIGRVTGAGDDPTSAVVSHRFWKAKLNQDAAITGKTLTIGRLPVTVVGVAPPEFFGEAAGQAPDVWLPVEAQQLVSRGQSLLDRPNVSWLKVMARLAPGVDEGTARAALAVFVTRLKTEPGRIGGWVSGIHGLELSSGMRGLDELRESYSRPLHVLTVIAGVVLLIACANVANLLLARGAKRQREISIRLALGAKRGRVIRQLMTENVCLAALGGALGVVLAVWATQALLVLASRRPEPLPLNASIDGRVLLFTVAVSILSSLLFGLMPAIQATRGRRPLAVPAQSRPRQLLGRMLVGAQVAMSVLLLSAAGLFVRTLDNLRSQDVGFRPERLMQVRVDAPGYAPAALPELYARLLAAVRTTPGVESASLSQSGFNTGTSRTCCIAVEGREFAPGENREVRTNSVMPDYFATIGLPLLSGRNFTSADAADEPRVVIVSRSAARKFFGEESPVGRRMGWGDPPKVRYNIEVIGVAEDLNTGNLREEMRPMLFLPARSGRVLHVRAAGDPVAMAGMLRQTIQRADSTVTVRGVQTIEAVINSAVAIERLMAMLATFFGALALCLAAVGLYGVVDYSVRQRTQEIGVRMALGARPVEIVRMVSRETGLMVASGVAAGIAAALGSGSLIESMLYRVRAWDPTNLAIAAAAMLLTGAVAAVAPSRRAASVAPLTALRHE